jgi:hypothetical protein
MYDLLKSATTTLTSTNGCFVLREKEVVSVEGGKLYGKSHVTCEEVLTIQQQVKSINTRADSF